MAATPYYLANEPCAPADAALLPVTDKYSGTVLGHVALAGPAAIEQAIAAAAAAAAPMRRLPAYRRRDALRHAAAQLQLRSEALINLLGAECGKPLRDARVEVARLIETFEIAAAESLNIAGEVLDLSHSPRAAGTRGLTRRVPVGPCSFFTPFNFPLNLCAHKVAPALAAGCPFILKPSERTPLSALAIGDALASADLPPGAFSILPCALDHLAPLVEDPRLALFSFTGSAEVGWSLRARAGKKRVTLELGGNAACVIDADQRTALDAIVARLLVGAFAQSGQSCISVQRVLVHRSLFDDLAARLAAAAAALPVGDPCDPETVIGPLIDEPAARRVSALVNGALAHGARALCGGPRRGALYPPTLLTDVPDDHPLWREEIFGPVAALRPFDDFAEALRLVNDSRFGLQAGIFTNDLAHAMQAWDELEVGGVIVGDIPSFRVDAMPYGGVKDSGCGREGVRAAIADMTEPRLLVLRGLP